MNCPICQSETLTKLFDAYDDRYGFKGFFNLFQCINCDHIFLSASFTPEKLGILYSDYYPRSTFNIDDYRPHTESQGFCAWLNGDRSAPFHWIPKNVKILDIGCGFGESLGYHKARGCKVYGVEADSNIQRVADKYGFDVHVGLFDPAHYEENTFDYVTMSQVIEHIVDPKATMQGLFRILKPGGRIVLSMPNAEGWGKKFFGHYWINWHAPYHLHFYSRKSMSLLGQATGFTIEKTLTITSSAWLHYQWIHLITYPTEGQGSAFWSPKASKSLFEKVGIKLLNLLHLTKFNHLITRFFDILELGDSRIVVLRKPL